MLNGTKAWITNAGVPEFCTVMAVTDPDRGAHDISAYVVGKSDPGVSFGAVEKKLGIKGPPTRTVIFEDARIPADRIVDKPCTSGTRQSPGPDPADSRQIDRKAQIIEIAAWKPRPSGRGRKRRSPLPRVTLIRNGANGEAWLSVRMAYKCRAYPAPEQASVLNRTFGCVRVVWNRTLAWRHARYYGEQVKTGFTQANAYLTAMKATEDLAWLNEVSSVPLQQAIRHQQVAYTNFFAKRARYPRYKSRNGRQSAEYTRSGFRYRDGAAVPRQDGHAAGVRVVVAGHRPGLDQPDYGDRLP